MKRNILILLSIFVFMVLPLKCFGAEASLYISPSYKSYSPGQNFTAGIYVSSPDQAINAMSAAISFPADILETVSISKNNSISSFWVQEPSFSNVDGKITFEGVVLSPGFSGSGGKLISINFKAKKAGEAVVKFLSGSVLANDGKGTNIVGNFSNAKYEISSGESPEPVPVSTTPSSLEGTPSAPLITSSTHPDSSKWYGNDNPVFSWEMASGTTGASFILDSSPFSIPGTVSDGVVSKKQFKNVGNGVHYFHLRLRSDNGWGAVSHYGFKVDTIKPSGISLALFDDNYEKEGLRIKISANKDLSGISHFEIKIDNGEKITFYDSESRIYKLSNINPGKHLLVAEVFDKAGNSGTGFLEFEAKALDAPEIKEYSSEITPENYLVIKGSAYPNSKINIWMQKEKEIPVLYDFITSDASGNFTYIGGEKMIMGRYKLWLEGYNEIGLKTEKSRDVYILVEESNLSKLKSNIKNLIIIVSMLASFILLLFFMATYGLHKLKFKKQRVNKEIKEADDSVRTNFRELHKEIIEQIKELEKIRSRFKFSSKERRKMKEILEKAEKVIRKEIKDIKEEMR